MNVEKGPANRKDASFSAQMQKGPNGQRLPGLMSASEKLKEKNQVQDTTDKDLRMGV